MASDLTVFLWVQIWQVTAVVVLVGLLNRSLSRNRPHLAHMLWLVVLIKCLTPPVWCSPGGIFCWLQPRQTPQAPPTLPVAASDWRPLRASSEPEFWTPDADPPAVVDMDVASVASLLMDPALVPSAELPATDDAAGTQNPLLRTLWTAWWMSAVIMLGALLVRWMRFTRMIRATPRRDCPALEQQLARLRAQLGIRRSVRLLVTESRIGPAVVGIVRTTILLPAVIAETLTPASAAPILAHELLHIRRGDLWTGLLQAFVRCLWWFHPAVRWATSATRREAERCCDEEVLAELKCRPADYARALVDVLELKAQLQTVPVFPGVRPVEITSERLERIMTLRHGSHRRTPWWCWISAGSLALLTLPGAAFLAQAQPPADSASVRSSEPVSNTKPAPPLPPLMPAVGPEANFQLEDAAGAVIVRVYNLTPMRHLFDSDDSVMCQQYEALVRLCDPRDEATVVWHNDAAVVRAEAAVHDRLEERLSLLQIPEPESATIRDYLQSADRDSAAAIECRFMIAAGCQNDMRSFLEKLAASPSDAHGATLTSWDQWSAAWAARDRTGDCSEQRPRCMVSNAHSVRCTIQQPCAYSLMRRDDGCLHLSAGHTGTQLFALPWIKQDGSIQLSLHMAHQTSERMMPLPPELAAQFPGVGEAPLLVRHVAEFSDQLLHEEIRLVQLNPENDAETDWRVVIAIQVCRIPAEAVAAITQDRDGSRLTANPGADPDVALNAVIPAGHSQTRPFAAQPQPAAVRPQSPRVQIDVIRPPSAMTPDAVASAPRSRLVITHDDGVLQATADNIQRSDDNGRQRMLLSGSVQLKNGDDTLNMIAESIEVILAGHAAPTVAIHAINSVAEVHHADQQSTLRAARLSLELAGTTMQVRNASAERDVAFTSRMKDPAIPTDHALHLRTYAVADLVVPVHPAVGGPVLIMTTRDQPPENGVMWEARATTVASDVAPQAPGDSDRALPATSLQNLIDLITTCVEPDSWDRSGGAGSITASPATLSLVVRQSAGIHQQVELLLKQLRALQDIQLVLRTHRLTLPTSVLDSIPRLQDLSDRSSVAVLELTTAERQQLLQGMAGTLQAAIAPAPSVTLFNGQTLRLQTEPGPNEGVLTVQAVSAPDRRTSRVAISTEPQQQQSPPGAPLETIQGLPDGGCLLILTPRSQENATEPRQALLMTVTILSSPEVELNNVQEHLDVIRH